MSEEQPDFVYLKCPDCDYDMVLRKPANSRIKMVCGTCLEDNGREVIMKMRVCKSDDVVEGRDARKDT